MVWRKPRYFKPQKYGDNLQLQNLLDRRFFVKKHNILTFFNEIRFVTRYNTDIIPSIILVIVLMKYWPQVLLQFTRESYPKWACNWKFHKVGINFHIQPAKLPAFVSYIYLGWRWNSCEYLIYSTTPFATDVRRDIYRCTSRSLDVVHLMMYGRADNKRCKFLQIAQRAISRDVCVNKLPGWTKRNKRHDAHDH